MDSIARRSFSRLLAVFVLGLLAASTLPAPAAAASNVFDPVGSFMELDGNPTQDGSLSTWDSLFAPNASAPAGLVASAFAPDAANPDPTYHGGSDKDTSDVSAWTCVVQLNPQNKSDVQDAYASEFRDANGVPYLYFGFERATNNGDAYMGFWFIQSSTSCASNPSGPVSFAGAHRDHDVLVLSNFTNGGTTANVTVYQWLHGNLSYVTSGGPCPPTAPRSQLAACGIVNTATVTTPWSPSTHAPNTFFEGALNFQALFPGVPTPCYGSFVAETRTSQSLTATLKDYAGAPMPTCDARLSVTPSSASHNVGETQQLTAFVQSASNGPWSPVQGNNVTFTIASGPGSLLPSSCTTDASGHCAVNVTSNVAGATAVSATTTVTVGGTSFTRNASSTITWSRIAVASFTTTPSVTDLTLGGSLADAATLAGSLGAPTGNVTFQSCAAGACAAAGSAALSNGSATSPAFTPLAAGSPCFQASYSGDGTYLPANESAPGECYQVDKANLASLTTSASPAGQAPTGTHTSDVATLVGLGGAFPAPTGTVDFQLCEGDSCRNATSGAVANGSASSGPLEVQDNATQCWSASYEGDANYNASGESSSNGECFQGLSPASLSVTKLMEDGNGNLVGELGAGPGSVVEYVLAVTNGGDLDASNVTLADVLDPSLVLASCSCVATGQSLQWNVGDVPAHSTLQYFLNVTVSASVPAGETDVPNAATASSDAGSATSGNATLHVYAFVDPHVVKSAQESAVAPGGTIHYTLTYWNAGNTTAPGVVLTEHLPNDVTNTTCACGPFDLPPGGSLASPAGASTLDVTLGPSWGEGSACADGAGVVNSVSITGGADNSTCTDVLRPASLAVTKLVNDGNGTYVTDVGAGPGSTLEYEIEVSNTGQIDATNVTVTDVLPAALGGRTVTFDVGTVGAGDTVVLFLNATVSTNVPAGESDVPNAASASADDAATATSGNATAHVYASVDPHVVKAAQERAVAPGGTIHYSLTYWNAGNATDAGVVLTEHLPNDTTGTACSCGPFDLPPGGSFADPAGVATLAVTLGPSWGEGSACADGAGVVNSVSVTGGADDSTCTDVLTPANLSLTKLVAAGNGTFGTDVGAGPGSVLEYELTATNGGQVDATNVTVTDVLPAALGSPSCSCTVDGQTVTWDVGTLAGGASTTLFLNATVSTGVPAGETDVPNAASVSADDAASADSGNATAHVYASVDPHVVKTAAESSVPPGGTIHYSLAYWNAGNATDPGVTLTEHLPNDTTASSCACGPFDLPPGGSLADPAGTALVNVTLGSSWNDSSSDCAANPPTGVVNTVSIPGGADASACVPVLDPAALAVTKLVDDGNGSFVAERGAGPGSALSYQINVTNTGDLAATNVTVTDVLPAALGGATLTWDVGTLDGHQSTVLSFQANVTGSFTDGVTSVPNTATASADGLAPVTSAAATVDVYAASALSATKVADRDTVLPNGTITYTIGFANDGNATAAGVDVLDPLPAHAQFVSASDGCAFDAPSDTVDCSVGDVAPDGAHHALTIVVTLDGALADGDVVTNVATFQGTGIGFDSPAANVTVVTTDLTATKLVSVDGGPFGTDVGAGPGDTLAFHVTVSNAGSQPSGNVTVTDTLDAHLAYDGQGCGGCSVDGQTLTWTLPPLSRGNATTLRFNATLDRSFPEGATLVQNTVGASDDQGNGLSDPPVVNVTVVAHVGAGLAKSGPAATLPDAPFDYVLAYWNDGNATWPASTLTDTLDAPLTLVSAPASCAAIGQVVSCSLPDVPPGSNATSPAGNLTLVVEASASAVGTDVTNQAHGSAAGAPVDSNVVTTYVQHPPRFQNVTKAIVQSDGSLVTSASPAPGSNVTFQLNVTNVGDVTMHNVTLVDALPTNVTYVGDACSGSATLRCFLGDVAANATTGVTIPVALDAVFPNGTTLLTNTFTATADDAANASSNTATLTVTAQPVLHVDKRSDNASGAQGGVVSFTLTVWNTGSANDPSLVVTDELPNDTTVTACSPPCDTSQPGLATWNVSAPVVADESQGVVLHVSLRLGPSWRSGESMTNQATADGATGSASVLVVALSTGGQAQALSLDVEPDPLASNASLTLASPLPWPLPLELLPARTHVDTSGEQYEARQVLAKPVTSVPLASVLNATSGSLAVAGGALGVVGGTLATTELLGVHVVLPTTGGVPLDLLDADVLSGSARTQADPGAADAAVNATILGLKVAGVPLASLEAPRLNASVDGDAAQASVTTDQGTLNVTLPAQLPISGYLALREGGTSRTITTCSAESSAWIDVVHLHVTGIRGVPLREAIDLVIGHAESRTRAGDLNDGCPVLSSGPSAERGGGMAL